MTRDSAQTRPTHPAFAPIGFAARETGAGEVFERCNVEPRRSSRGLHVGHRSPSFSMNLERLFERHLRAQRPEPARVARPHHVEQDAVKLFLDMVETRKGRIEFFAEVLGEARPIAGQEAVGPAAPSTVQIDGIVEFRRPNFAQESRLQAFVDEASARRGDVVLLLPGELPNPHPHALLLGHRRQSPRIACASLLISDSITAPEDASSSANTFRHGALGGEIDKKTAP